ncbi:MAG: histidinol-phosphatase [Clostridiales bacterium]|nr:histidinol-phosphatase [Clostridiales bacterium]
MRLSNFHTHCYLCDGQGTPKQYFNAAISQKLCTLGFSSHAPLPFDTSWTMDELRLQKYLKEIRELKDRKKFFQKDNKKDNKDNNIGHIDREKYTDKNTDIDFYAETDIDIKIGLEIDYISGVTAPSDKKWRELDLDYCIGSVHFLGLYSNDGSEYWTVDGPDEMLDKGIRENFGGDNRGMVELYYRLLAEMAQLGGFDFVGHFDLVKKNNANSKYFDENAGWYKKAATETLEVIAAKGLMLEVNTGGISRGYTKDFYPSVDLLKICKKLGIRIVLNSDAHMPEWITAFFPQALDAIREAGYRELYALGKNGWEETLI